MKIQDSEAVIETITNFHSPTQHKIISRQDVRYKGMLWENKARSLLVIKSSETEKREISNELQCNVINAKNLKMER